jgi:hypothetical protein
MYKLYTGKEGISFSSYFNTNCDKRTRGHQAKITKSNCNMDIRKFAFRNRNSQIWNSLPTEIIESPNVGCFSKKLLLYLQTVHSD